MEQFYWVFEKTYELHESVISLWRMEMSNPKGQHLESVFPLPWGIGCFPEQYIQPYTHTSICTSMFIYESGAGRVQAEQRCPVTGTVPVPGGSPCPTEFMTSVNWTLVLQMENQSTCDWLPEIGQGSLWRIDLNGCQVKSLGLQTGQPVLSEADALEKLLASLQRDPYVTENSSCLVKAQITRSLSSSHSHEGWASVLQTGT